MPVLRWVPFPDLWDSWKTRPTQTSSSWGSPPLPPSRHPFCPPKICSSCTPRTAVTKPSLYYSREPVLQNRSGLELRLCALLPPPKTTSPPALRSLPGPSSARRIQPAPALGVGTDQRCSEELLQVVPLAGRSPALCRAASTPQPLRARVI